MKIIHIHKFQTPHGTVEFVPVADVPGHTHRVVIDGVAQAGLWVPAGQRISTSTAVFYIRVVAALRDGLPKYHYVDRKEDPPVPIPAAA